MKFLKKLFRQEEKAGSTSNPIWVANFAPAEYKRFLHLICTYFDQAGEKYKIQRGEVILLNQDCSYNLQNIAQVCHQAERDKWPALIQAHFVSLNNAHQEHISSPETSIDFEQLASNLAVRIWPDGTLKSSGQEGLVYREDLPGTVSVLVYDRPDSVQAVSPKMAAQWGKSTQELFAIGLSNVRSQCHPEKYLKELDQGIHVHVLTSESFFTTTYALLISEFPALLGSYGTLFGIPHRQVMVCYPIQDVQVLPAMQQLIPIVGQLFQEGPGSVSPHLYWYSQGKYSAILLDPQKKSMYIPPEFTEVLSKIAEHAKK